MKCSRLEVALLAASAVLATNPAFAQLTVSLTGGGNAYSTGNSGWMFPAINPVVTG